MHRPKAQRPNPPDSADKQQQQDAMNAAVDEMLQEQLREVRQLAVGILFLLFCREIIVRFFGSNNTNRSRGSPRANVSYNN